MKKFKQPDLNLFGDEYVVIGGIAQEFGEIEMLGMADIPAINETSTNYAKTIDVDMYGGIEQSGLTVFFVFARNRSLNESFLMFRSVLDSKEKDIFNSFMDKHEYDAAAEYLSENTF